MTRYKKETKIPFPLTLGYIALFVIGLFILPFPVFGQDYREVSVAVDNLTSEIRQADGAVGQVLMEAMSANHGNIQKWNVLEEKMNALGQTIDRNLPEIGRNLAILRKIEPDTRAPDVSLGRTFEGNLNMARDKKKQLLEMAKEEQGKIEKINDMLAKVDKDLLNAAKGLMVATVEGFLPDEISLAGEASVVVLGAFFGPVGIAAAGVAWAATGTFNSMVNLYYNTKGAADQAKALTEMKQGLQARKAELEKNVKILMDGAREMEQIEQILEKQDKKLNEYKEKINKAQEAWNEQSKEAFEQKKQKLEEEIKKEMSKPKSSSKWTLCNGREISLKPSDYEGDVNSMISQLESYTRAVEDGGDPDNFYAMVVDWYNKMNDQYKKKLDDRNSKWETYNRVSNTCYESYRACTNSCRDSGCYSACSSRYCGCLISSQEAYYSSAKELSKIYRIYDSVDNVYYLCRERVDNAIKARSREFWDAYSLWRTKFGEVNSKTYQAVSGVPYGVEYWKERAERLDSEIQDSLRWGLNIYGWGSDIYSIRNNLIAYAEYLRGLDKTVKEATQKYNKANLERILVSNQAQNELTSLLNQWGRLIGYYGGFHLPWLGDDAEFTPRAAEAERNVAFYEKQIKTDFIVRELENLKSAKKVDLLGIAAIYEKKANELNFYTDWVDTYRHRLAEAVGILNRISQEQTKQGFYARKEDLLKKELSGPPWAAISQEVERYITKEEFSKLPMARNWSWDGLTLWQKLYGAQQVLLERLKKEAPNYVQVRLNGGFQPVPPAIMEPLEKTWLDLRRLCEQYDALAKPVREAIGNAPEEIQKAAQPVFETYVKMPQLSRDIINNEHKRFSDSYNWLKGYLTGKRDALKVALGDSVYATQLDNLILNYSALYERYKRMEEEAQRMWEEQTRRAEEEQKRREEEERRQAEEQKRKAEAQLTAVKDLYNQFKRAYESKNDALVVSLLSNSWTAQDGSTISDLQANLRRIYRVFDEVRYNIQNLNIVDQGDGRYMVSYNLTITSRQYKKNLKHEESSALNEEVVIDNNGKAKINRTLSGRFWLP